MTAAYKVRYAMDIINKANNNRIMCEQFEVKQEHHDYHKWEVISMLTGVYDRFIQRHCTDGF